LDSTRTLQQAQQQAQQVEEIAGKQIAGDNRARMNAAFEGQSFSRARNVVSQMDRNFDASAVQRERGEKSPAEFNARWLQQNQLSREEEGKKAEKIAPTQQQPQDGQSRLRKGKSSMIEEQERRDASSLGIAQKDEKAAGERPAEQMGMPGGMPAEERPADAVTRYQERLKQRQGGLQQEGEFRRGVELQRQDRDDPFAVPSDKPQGMVGGQLAPPAAAMPSPETPPAAGLASLDVDLPMPGAVYRFTMPEGDIQITARAVSQTLLQRLVWAAAVALTALLVLAVAGACRRGRFGWFATATGSVLLIVAGAFSVLLGVAPLLGLAAFAGGSAAAARRVLAKKKPAKTAPAM
jgi:hypothetical protein